MKKKTKKQNKNLKKAKATKRRKKFPARLAELLKRASKLAFIEVKVNDVYVYIPDKPYEKFRATMKEVKSRIKGKKWIACHRSFMINKAKIKSSDRLGSMLHVSFESLKAKAFVTKRRIKHYILQGGKMP